MTDTTNTFSPPAFSEALPDPYFVPRIGAAEVCRLAEISRPTLTRRIAAGKYPKPVERGRETLFSRLAIYETLGIVVGGREQSPQEENPWMRGGRVLQELADAKARRR